jgi:hypothetical protein
MNGLLSKRTPVGVPMQQWWGNGIPRGAKCKAEKKKSRRDRQAVSQLEVMLHLCPGRAPHFRVASELNRHMWMVADHSVHHFAHSLRQMIESRT